MFGDMRALAVAFYDTSPRSRFLIDEGKVGHLDILFFEEIGICRPFAFGPIVPITPVFQSGGIVVEI